jgi:hypothetical protein
VFKNLYIYFRYIFSILHKNDIMSFRNTGRLYSVLAVQIFVTLTFTFFLTKNANAQCAQITNYTMDTLTTSGDYPNALNQVSKAKGWYNAGVVGSTPDYFYQNIFDPNSAGAPEITTPSAGWSTPGNIPSNGYMGLFVNQGTTANPLYYKEYIGTNYTMLPGSQESFVFYLAASAGANDYQNDLVLYGSTTPNATGGNNTNMCNTSWIPLDTITAAELNALTPGVWTQKFFLAVNNSGQTLQSFVIGPSCPGVAATQTGYLFIDGFGRIAFSDVSVRTDSLFCNPVSSFNINNVTCSGFFGCSATYLWETYLRPSGATMPSFSNATIRNPVISNLQQGHYVFKVTISLGGCNEITYINVYNGIPKPNLGADITFCGNQMGSSYTINPTDPMVCYSPPSATCVTDIGAYVQTFTLLPISGTDFGSLNVVPFQQNSEKKLVIYKPSTCNFSRKIQLTYSKTINGVTCTSRDTITITNYDNNIVIDQMRNDLCANDTVATLSSANCTLPVGTTFQWSSVGNVFQTAGGVILSPSSSSTIIRSRKCLGKFDFILITTFPNGCIDRDTITGVEFKLDPPVSSAGLSYSGCDTFCTNFTLNSCAGIVISSYTWEQYSSSTNQWTVIGNSSQYTPQCFSCPGSYMYRVTREVNTGVCIANQIDTIIVNYAYPSLGDTETITYCGVLPYQKVVNIDPLCFNADAPLTYQWSCVSGCAFQSFTTSNGGKTLNANFFTGGTYSYNLTVTWPCGTSKTYLYSYQIQQYPSGVDVNLGPDITLCPQNGDTWLFQDDDLIGANGGSGTPSLNISYPSGTFYSFDRSTGTITFSAHNGFPSVPATFTIRVTHPGQLNPCRKLSDTVLVTIRPRATVNDITVCDNGSTSTLVNLVGYDNWGTGPASNADSVRWTCASGCSNTSITNPTSLSIAQINLNAVSGNPGKIVLSMYSGSCVSRDTVYIYEVTQYTAYAGNDLIDVCWNSYYLQAGIGTTLGNIPDGVSYTWTQISPSTPSAIMIPATDIYPDANPYDSIATGLRANTTYTFRLTMGSGTCSSTDDITITTGEVVDYPYAGIDKLICSGNTTSLSGVNPIPLPGSPSIPVWELISMPPLISGSKSITEIQNCIMSSTSIPNPSINFAITTCGGNGVRLRGGEYCFRYKILNPSGNPPACDVWDTVCIYWYLPGRESITAGRDTLTCSTSPFTLTGSSYNSDHFTPLWQLIGANTTDIPIMSPTSGTSQSVTLSNILTGGSYYYSYSLLPILESFDINSTNCAINDTVLLTFTPIILEKGSGDLTLCATGATSIPLNGLISGATTTGTWSTKLISGTPSATPTFSPNATTLNATLSIPLPTTDSIIYWVKLTSSDPDGSGTACTSVKDSFKVTIYKTPNALADFNVCLGAGITLTANPFPTGSVWTALNGGNITSPNNATTTVTGINSIGAYNFQVSYRGCVDNVQVSVIKPEVSINASPSTTVCLGNPATLSVTPNTGTYTSFQWATVCPPAGSFVSFNPTYTTPNLATGTYNYSVIVSQGACKDTACVTITAVTDANAGSDGTLSACDNKANTLINLYNVIVGEQSGGTWSFVSGPSSSNFDAFNATFNSYNATAGTYVFRYFIDAPNPCTDDESFATITVIDALEAGIGGTITVCQNSPTLITLSDIITNEQTGGTWSIASGSPGANFNATNGTLSNVGFALAAGTYTFRYIFPNGGTCRDTATATVVVRARNWAGNDINLSVCSDTGLLWLDNIHLNLASYPLPTSGGTWSVIQGSPGGNFNNSLNTLNTNGLSGTYILRYIVNSSASPCLPDTSYFTVNISGKQEVSLPSNIQVCRGTSQTVTATGASSGTYIWGYVSGNVNLGTANCYTSPFTVIPGNTATVSLPTSYPSLGSYTLRVIHLDGLCNDTTCTVFTVNDPPNASMSDVVICGTYQSMSVGNVTGGGTVLSWSYANGLNVNCSTGSFTQYASNTSLTYSLPSAIVNNYGFYTVRAVVQRTSTGCIDTVCANVSNYKPNISLSDVTICQGTPTTLTVLGTSATGVFNTISYTLNSATCARTANIISGQVVPNIVLPAAIYNTIGDHIVWVTYYDGFSSCNDTVCAIIHVISKPNAGTDQSLCSVTSTTLTATPAGTGTWTQISGAAVTITSPTSSTTNISGLANGIYSFEWAVGTGCRDTVQVTVNAKPVINDQTVCQGSSLTVPNTVGGLAGTYSQVC